MNKIQENKTETSNMQRNGVPIIDSKDLFGVASEVVIIHDGTEYRLKITKLGKLILNK